VIYTAEIADTILSKLCEGQTLREICRNDESLLPAESTSGFGLWKIRRVCGALQPGPRGRLSLNGDEVLELADDGRNDWIQRRKEAARSKPLLTTNISAVTLRFDARRWLLSKALPKIYGDRST